MSGLYEVESLSALRSIVSALHVLTEKVANMSVLLDTLNARVAENTLVTSSAVALLQSIHTDLEAAIAQCAASAEDLAGVQAVSDELAANTAILSNAVAANTVAADEPPIEEPVVPEEVL